MKTIQKKDFTNILEGANLLGTGGGGTIQEATLLLKQVTSSVKLVSLPELRKDDLICTIFGVGGKGNCDPVIASKAAFKLFQKTCTTKIKALIPVEVGTVGIATSFFIANKLQIPVLDSDIVGLRSSPEVFLETITLVSLTRTPCAVADSNGNSLVIMKSENVEKLETILRNFAAMAGGDAYVAGYPLLAKELINVTPFNSVSFAEEVGCGLQEMKEKNLSFIAFCKKFDMKLILEKGIITKYEVVSKKGFEFGEYTIQAQKETYSIIVKNENIVLLKNGRVLITCPDSIYLLDLETIQGINNFEANTKKAVAILAKKAIPIWRTKEGRRLFSPKNLGLSYVQKLI